MHWTLYFMQSSSNSKIMLLYNYMARFTTRDSNYDRLTAVDTKAEFCSATISLEVYEWVLSQLPLQQLHTYIQTINNSHSIQAGLNLTVSNLQ